MIERCEEVKLFDTVSVEYQSALDDLRGTIRELVEHSTNEKDKFNPTMCYWVNVSPARFWYAIFNTAIWTLGWFLLFIDYDPGHYNRTRKY